MMKNRRQNLINQALKLGCDTLVAFSPENIFYMTGFWGECIVILKNTLDTIIITSELEEYRAKTESIDCTIIKSTRDNLTQSLLSITKNCKVCTDCNDCDILKSLNRKSYIVRSTTPFLNSRLIKDKDEINTLQKAATIIDNLFDMCINKIQIGQTEYELQTFLMSKAMEYEMFDTGYKFTINPLIIAGGPNAALPHSQVTHRKFNDGDLVVVDLTLRYKGYVSDATRTFGLGTISKTAKQIYDIVKTSQSYGINNVHDGITCSSIDRVCRKYIHSHSYGKYFVHSTGHGVGIDVHEPPIISSNNKTKLNSNMTITIEPGIYIPGKLGVRIEDSLVVTDKYILLHKFTKDLLIL